MSTRRSRSEICFDVLEKIKEGVQKPTKIMYRTNISWTVLDDILDQLKEQGLIMEEKTGKRIIYEITEKGNNVLGSYRYAYEQVALTSH